MVRETRLTPDRLIYPLFVVPGAGVRNEIGSLPGCFHLSVDEAAREAPVGAPPDEPDTHALRHELLAAAQERGALVQPGTNDLEAYNLYLQGRYHISRFTEDDLREAVELFRAAIQRDPGYADAYAGISDAWAWLADDWLPPREAFPRAEAAARKATFAPTEKDGITVKVSGTLTYDFP